MDIKELKSKRAGLVTQMRALTDAADKAGRDLSADETINFNNLEKEFDTVSARVTREDNLSAAEAKLGQERDSNYRSQLDDANPGKQGRASDGYLNAFFGAKGFLRKLGNISSLAPDVFNVLQTGIDTDGGYLVPEAYEAEILKLLYAADPLRRVATVMTLSTDKNIPVQTGGVSFSWVGENGAFNAVNPSVGRVILSAHKLGGYIPVSTEMLQDSLSNVESFVRDVAVTAVSQLENAAYTTGSGAAQPEGLFTVSEVAGTSISNTTGAVSATAAITGDNFIDIFHALAVSHRTNAKWLMADAMVKLVRKLKDLDGQYIWQPGLIAGAPDTILTKEVLVSEFAPNPAVSTKSIVFGDFSRYTIVDRLGMSMQRLNELGALNGQVYFLTQKRTDGRLTDANAITTFTHGAAS
jgi:HK97 family phage major capsid protein